MGLQSHWPTPVNAVNYYLFYINFILAAFNLLPAFPLDGGRVLRSILWGAKGNMRWATRVSSSIGSAFGLGLIFLGVSGSSATTSSAGCGCSSSACS